MKPMALSCDRPPLATARPALPVNDSAPCRHVESTKSKRQHLGVTQTMIRGHTVHHTATTTRRQCCNRQDGSMSAVLSPGPYSLRDSSWWTWRQGRDKTQIMYRLRLVQAQSTNQQQITIFPLCPPFLGQGLQQIYVVLYSFLPVLSRRARL